MPYPHQPGSPQFDGAEAFEDYQDEQERLRLPPDKVLIPAIEKRLKEIANEQLGDSSCAPGNTGD